MKNPSQNSTSLSPFGIRRRHYLMMLAATGLTWPFGVRGISKSSIPSPTPGQQEWWVSAQGKAADKYSLGWLKKDGRNLQKTISGFRGHGVLQHPQKPHSVIFLARRPGTEGLQINLSSGEIENRFGCQTNHHLQGHGCFSGDGKVLFTCESNFKNGAGKIVVRDSDSYRVLDEFSSHGIGPHEIKLMPDGQTLVIANGGLHTHPSSGRQILNLETMRSTLTYMNAANGELIDEYQVDEPKASIRHLDVANDGTVAIAMQVQRAAVQHQNTIGLSAIHQPGQAIKLLNQPATVLQKLNDYIGSVTINNRYRTVGFTSPRGNLAVFWNLDEQRFIGYQTFHDVCGLAVTTDERHFVLSNSNGEIRQLNSKTLRETLSLRRKIPGAHWDNHLLSIPFPRT
ncbi:MAG: DUF1513 domain-containing protein [Pseudomonadales bacterium]|nr:DUF1513 domain-containing protein [Pseudomonadales bacterium]